MIWIDSSTAVLPLLSAPTDAGAEKRSDQEVPRRPAALAGVRSSLGERVVLVFQVGHSSASLESDLCAWGNSPTLALHEDPVKSCDLPLGLPGELR
jgi:hypothetical protein